MIVKILDDVFYQNNNKLLTKLIYILDDRYYLDINPNILENSTWYNEEVKKIKTNQDILEGLINKSIFEAPSSKNTITISCKNEKYFSLEEAIIYLDQSFSIIFENSNNDSLFFDALLKNFPKQIRKILKFKDNLWLEYSMAGGSAEDIIKTKIKSYNISNFNKEKHKYLRCFVITDSDKLYPDMDLKDDKVKLKEFLDKNEIKYHFLEKREMENYLPDEVFEEIKNNENSDYIEAYLRLSSEQKDFFDIQKGFPDKNFNDLKPDGFRDFFNKISDEDKRIFRKKDLQKIHDKSFKSEFPKLFSHEKVTKETLLNRTKHQKNPNELIDILKKIEALL
ncbi:MAG: hypothetical protein U0457_09280 [Candidatus Sericytochromatia bacterium]